MPFPWRGFAFRAWRLLTIALVLARLFDCRLTCAAETADGGATAPLAEDNRTQAERHFQLGLKLAEQLSWDAALAEFLRSRELYVTRAATRNAAIALQRLGRYAESAELYQALLGQFAGAMAAEQVDSLRRELAEVERHTAEVTFEVREPNVSVMLDGRLLGATALAGSTRVNPGTHRVRVSKDGFETSEQSFTIAAGGKRVIIAAPRPLSNVGRIVVSEASGRRIGVFVDGSFAGTTPWSGVLSSGGHTVHLRGAGGLGTAPGAATVRSNDTLMLVLRAVALDSQLRVEPVPSTAAIYLDGVLVGAGIWEGALPSGTHRVEATAAGHWLYRRRVELRAGERRLVRIQLERDVSSALWRRPGPSPLYAEAALGVLVADSLHGGADDACDCRPVALGASAAGRIGYMLSQRLGLEATLGVLSISEDIERSLQLRSDTGLLWESKDYRDSVRLTGPWLGVGAALRTSGTIPVTVRATTGLAALQARASNSGTFTSTLSSGQTLARAVSVPEQPDWLLAPFVSTEIRGGYRISPRVSVDIGVGLTLFLPQDSQRLGVDSTFSRRGAALPDMGEAQKAGKVDLPNELVAGAFLALSPSLSLRVGL